MRRPSLVVLLRAAAWTCAALLFGVAAVALPASAQDTVLTLEGEVPSEGDYFLVPFEVPAGIAELEIAHDDLSEANILDWGVLGPGAMFRGYGGGNSESAVLNADAASRSYLAGPIEAGTWAVYVGKARIDETPARYQIVVTLRTATTLPAQPERAPYAPAAPLAIGERWYAGDFHVHSDQSGDASASLEDIARYAEMIGLDFVMISDHNTTAQLDYYAQIQAAHPSLLFIPGVEVTTYQGHAMSLGGTQWIDHRLGFEGRTIVQIAEEVRAQRALFTVNHPALSVGDACIGCAWASELEGSLIDALEVQTGAYSVTGSIFFGRVVTRWENYLSEGHHVVALGGSDDHRAGTGTGSFDSPIGSPTTMVYAAELSVDAILEGVRAGRTVVRLEGASDPMVELSSADLVEGDTIVADSARLRVRVTGASEGASLVLIRDGVRGAEHEVMSDDFDYEETVIAGAGLSFVRAELSIAGRPRVVTSHIFLRALTPGGPDAGLSPDAGEAPMPPATSGCACRAGAPRSATAPWLAWIALALVITRRRTRRD